MKKTLIIIILAALGITFLCIGAYSFKIDIDNGFDTGGNYNFKFDLPFFSLKNLELHEIDQEIKGDMTNVNTLNIQSMAADIYISYDSNNNNKVSAHLYGNLNSAEDNIPELIIEENENTLKIYVKYPKTNSATRSVDLKLDVVLPDEYEQKYVISSISGNVKAGNINAKSVNASLTSGDIYFNSFNVQKINLNTISGDIVLYECAFDETKLNTTSGNINITKSKTDTLKAVTVSGDVEINSLINDIDVNTVSGSITILTGKLKEECRLSSVSGSVLLALPADLPFDFCADTVSGSISLNGFEIAITKAGKKVLEGKVNGGGSGININTTSGHITVKNANAADF